MLQPQYAASIQKAQKARRKQMEKGKKEPNAILNPATCNQENLKGKHPAWILVLE